MEIIEIKQRTEILLEQLLTVWEKSVRETHLFLSDVEIATIKKYVPQALIGISHLLVAQDGKQRACCLYGDRGKYA